MKRDVDLVVGPSDLVTLIVSTHLLLNRNITLSEYCEICQLDDHIEAMAFLTGVTECMHEMVARVAQERN